MEAPDTGVKLAGEKIGFSERLGSPLAPRVATMSQLSEKVVVPQEPSKIASGRFQVLHQLGPVGLLAGTSAVLPGLGGLVLLGTLTSLAPEMRTNPTTYLPLYILGFAVLCGLAMLPTYAVSLMGGWVFGFALGFPAAMVAFTAAAAIGYAAGATTSRSRVLQVLQAHPRWSLVHRELVGQSPWRTLGLLTLLRLPPTMPFAMSNLVFSAAGIPLGIYLLATIIGLAPRSAMMVFFAAGMQNLVYNDESTGEGRWVWLVGIALTAVVLVIITRLANRALARTGGMETP